MTEKTASDLAFTREDLHGTTAEATYGGALSFLRRRYTRELKGVDVAVIGVPFDTATTNRPGARFGPRAIRAASANLAWARPYGWDFDPFDRLAVIDAGDCAFDFGRPAGVPAEIEEHARAVLDAGVALLTLGGDHFITYPLLRAHAAVHGPLSLIHFDAHSDTWADEDGRIDHGTMFFHAAREGVVDPVRSVQIGLRTHNPDTLGFTLLDAPFVHTNGIAAVVEAVRRVVGGYKAYLTFDIDCLDPAFAPGTGTPVCGGLSTSQALQIVRGLAGIDVVGMDLVEVAPAYDVGEVTALAGATLAHEFLCLFAEAPARRATGAD
jgi:agmatinase